MILLTVLMILLGSFYKLEEAIPTSLSRLSRPTIILDAGHGGEDGGAVGVDGIIEKDINLSIAQDLRDLLVMNGYTVVMTRDSDTAIYDPGMETLREKKVSDLENRLELMKEYPGSIFIRISSVRPSIRAPRSFTAPIPRPPRSWRRLSRNMQKQTWMRRTTAPSRKWAMRSICSGMRRQRLSWWNAGSFPTRTRPTNWWMRTTRSGWPL